MASRAGLSWLREHPAPSGEVNEAFTTSLSSCLSAAEVLIGMGEDWSKMNPAEGQRAADAVAKAKSANYDGAMAFARLVAGN
jgi:hypothetical protein